MADTQVGTLPIPTTVQVDKRKLSGASAGNWSATYLTALGSITALRARLAAINGTIYNATYLNTMSTNDMVYALRLNDDNASF
jgi:hypothetical protein